MCPEQPLDKTVLYFPLHRVQRVSSRHLQWKAKNRRLVKDLFPGAWPHQCPIAGPLVIDEFTAKCKYCGAVRANEDVA